MSVAIFPSRQTSDLPTVLHTKALCPSSASAGSILPILFLQGKPTHPPSLSRKQAGTPYPHPWKRLAVASVSGLISLCPNWVWTMGPLRAKVDPTLSPRVLRLSFVAALWSAGGSTSGSHHLSRVMPAVRLWLFIKLVCYLCSMSWETQMHQEETRHLAPSCPRRRQLCHDVKPQSFRVGRQAGPPSIWETEVEALEGEHRVH